MGRTPCCDKANVKRGPWSPEEDIILKQYLEKHGTGGNWIALPRKAGLKRCGKSCRLRWLNYLKPDIKRGGFTEEEDSIISSLYFTIGSRWSVIASNMPGRTDNEIKNYWNTTLKKKLVATGHTYPINNNNSTTGCGKISATSSSLNTNPTVECYSSSHSLPSLEDDSGFEITSTGNMFFRAPSSSSQELSSDFSSLSYAIAGNGGYDLSIDSLLDLDFDAIYSLISNEFPSFDQDLAEVTKPDQFMFSSTFTFNNV